MRMPRVEGIEENVPHEVYGELPKEPEQKIREIMEERQGIVK